MSKFRKFLTGATAFTVLTVITKLIGAFYRIPLTNIVGAEGIGLYQMVFPLYTVLLTLTSGGITTAMAKYVASLESVGADEGSRRVLGVTMKVLAATGGTAAVCLIVFCRFTARIQGNSDVALAYIGIAPATFFVAITACFRGYFQGKQNMFPTALSQLIEQVVKLAVGLALAALLIKESVAWAVFGATVGVSVSEFIAMIALSVYYLTSRAFSQRKNKIPIEKLKDIEAAELVLPERVSVLPINKEIFRNICKTAVPSALGSLILPLTQLADSVLIVNVLVGLGMGNAAATVLFGIVNGPINSLINLPAVVTLSISISLLPKVSSLKAKGEDINQTVLKALKYTCLLSIPCCAVFLAFPKEILTLLYTGGLTESQLETAATLLRLSSVTVFYVSILQIATSVLQAVGKAHIPAINLLIGAAIKVAFTLLLLIKMGISGAVIATVLCYIATTSLDFLKMKKLGIFGKGFYVSVTAPVIASGLMLVTVRLLRVATAGLSPKLGIVTALFCGGVIYILSIFLLRAVGKADIKGILGA